MPLLNSCCCCFSLRTGVKIMAVLSLLGCAYHLYAGVKTIAGGEAGVREGIKALQDVMKKAKIDADFDVDHVASVTFYMVIFEVIFNLLCVPVSVLLYLGSAKERADFLMPFIVYSPVNAFYGLLRVIIMLVLMHAPGYFYGLYAVAYIFGAVLVVYFVVVVFSLFTELREKHGDSNIGFFKM